MPSRNPSQDQSGRTVNMLVELTSNAVPNVRRWNQKKDQNDVPRRTSLIQAKIIAGPPKAKKATNSIPARPPGVLLSAKAYRCLGNTSLAVLKPMAFSRATMLLRVATLMSGLRDISHR